MSGSSTSASALSPDSPQPAPQIAAIPATTPFVAPEELARTAGRATLLRLGANESSFGTSPLALAAMAGELERTWWYGDPESFELRSKLAALHGCTLANITVASGIDELLGLTVRAYMAPGGLALTTLGSYPTFNYHVIGYGGKLASVPYRSDAHIDLDALARAARAQSPSVLYLANPDNPAGTFHPADRIRAFIDALPKTCMLIYDEAYGDFAPQDAVLREGLFANVIRVRTFSKAYGMAGARLGYALASEAVVATFNKIRLHYGVNRSAQVGALAALDDRAFVAGVARAVEAGREHYYAIARRNNLEVIPSHTNFVCMDLGTLERAQGLVRALLTLGVFIRKPGAPPLDRYVRVTVGTPPERDAFESILPRALALLT